MSERPVYVVGDSNVGSLHLALARPSLRETLPRPYHVRLATNGNVIQTFVYELADGRTILNPAVETQFSPTLKQAPTFWSDNHVVILFGTVEHTRLALLASGNEFALHGDEAAAPAVTTALAEAVFEDVFAQFGRGLAIISELSKGDFHMLAGPPPIEDNKILAAWFATQGNAAPRLATPAFRRLAYELSNRVLRRLVERHGGVFIPPPPQAFENGMLRPDLFADPYHANADYGVMVVEEIERLMSMRDQMPSKEIAAATA